MRFRLHAVTGLVALTTVACNNTGSVGSVTLETEDQQASYAIGVSMGRQLEAAADFIDREALRAGLEDVLTESEQRLPDQELQTVLTSFNEKVRAAMESRAAAEGEENRAEGEAFLAENGAREGVTTTASGLQYEVVRAGDGPRPTPGDRVTIHYRGTLIDGTEFDASYGGDPATFSVTGVIQGFSEGLQLMPVGSHYKLYIPGDLGYGVGGSAPDIGPNATLIFDIELLEIPE